MARRQPGVPQVIRDDIIADFIREMQIVGPVGVLNVSDTLVGMFFMGQRVPFEVNLLTPQYGPADVFTQGIINNGAAGALLADTGALPAGTYNILYSVTANSNNAGAALNVEHRDAANAANLAAWSHVSGGLAGDAFSLVMTPFRYELGLNERLRIIQDIAFGAAEEASAVIFARIQ